MMMSEQTSLVLAGLNHRTAPLELRERFSFGREATSPALLSLKKDVGFEEVALLSTCNRTEIYGAACGEPEEVERSLRLWLAANGELDTAELKGHLYTRFGEGTVLHLLRVAAGLDSLVLGEPQILGQVRNAFEAAKEAGTLDQRLSKLFQTALETGKAVRTSTELGGMPTSVASVAAQLVERVFGSLEGRSVLIIGAGEICASAAKHLAERKPDRLVVINRTAERAEELAACFCGSAAPLSRLCDELCAADVVLTSTSSPEPLIDRQMLVEVMRRRRGERLLLVDLAVPRDVEPQAASVNNVYLYNVDDLQQLAKENLKHREAEIPKAERIVESALQRFLVWESSLALVPTIVALRSRLESIRAAGVEQYVTKLPELDDRGRRCIEQMTQTIINRILHEPQMRLRQCAGPQSGAAMAESLRYLFDLDGHCDDR